MPRISITKEMYLRDTLLQDTLPEVLKRNPPIDNGDYMSWDFSYMPAKIQAEISVYLADYGPPQPTLKSRKWD